MASPAVIEQLQRDMREGKVNRPPRPPGSEPTEPYVYQEYPKMLYHADYLAADAEWQSAQRRVVPALDLQRDLDIKAAQERKDKATVIVRNGIEEQAMRRSGWRETPHAAKDVVLGVEADRAVDAAVRAFDDRRMSDAAKAEVEAHEEATNDHVTDLPAPKKRGRPAKAATE